MGSRGWWGGGTYQVFKTLFPLLVRIKFNNGMALMDSVRGVHFGFLLPSN